MAGPVAAGARVVVTGAAGRHAQLVLRLLGQRYDILATDRVPFPASPVPFVQADLCDAAAATELLRGAAGVIHLGAVPGPSATPPPHVDPSWSSRAGLGLEALTPAQLLHQNVASAWHVFEGAARARARRVVFSSSIFACGFSHAPTHYQPLYLPLDEEHPALPHESYGLSKLLGEQAAACVARSAAAAGAPLTVASLRFTNLVYPDKEGSLPYAAPSDGEPRNLLMWAWTKAQEVAQAHVLALEAPDAVFVDPHEMFLLAAPTTRFVEDTAALAARFFPDASLHLRCLKGNASPIQTLKAQALLGWQPSTVAALVRK